MKKKREIIKYFMVAIYEKNEKLICGNKFIKAIDMINKYRKAYPQQMQIGTSNFIHYDMEKQKFVTNMNYNV